MPPTIPVLGASTVNRKWVLEVNTGTVGAPVWTAVSGITNFDPVTDNPNWADDSDFASGGASSQTKTSYAWSATCTVSRKVDATTGTSYDVGQEALRAKAEFQTGPANSVPVRFYEYTPSGGPRVQAYYGIAGVGWNEQGGAYNALSTVQVTLTGQGALSSIAHPYPATPVVPVITSATPLVASTAGGGLCTIFGSGFLGTVATTGVKFGGTNATNWIVVNDNEIVATFPAHSAGSAQIVVTNSTGPSTTGPSVTYS